MNWTLAELKQRLADNPDLAQANSDLRLTVSAISDDVRALNPEVAQTLTAPEDCADTLLAYIKMLAPDLYPRCERDRPFGRYRIDIAIGMLAIEVDGGQWRPGGGKHGGAADYRKTRQLARAGYTVLRFTAGEVRNNPVGAIDEIRLAID